MTPNEFWQQEFRKNKKIDALKSEIKKHESQIVKMVKALQANPFRYPTHMYDKYITNKDSPAHKKIQFAKAKLILLGVPLDDLDESKTEKSHGWTTQLEPFQIHESNFDRSPQQTNSSKWQGDSPYSSKSKWR